MTLREHFFAGGKIPRRWPVRGGMGSWGGVEEVLKDLFL